jgi:shikimate kinase
MRKHIVLVGLPGAGKSTVGRLVAERLGASFFDTDGMIVRKMQMPITRIIGEHGELKFRDMERQAMAQALNGPAAVISPGGGWVAQPGALESAQPNSYLVYLRTMVLTAAKRAGGEGTRPLLVGEDPVEKMRTLLKERESFYLKANAEVKADIKNASQLADEIVSLAKQNAEW